MTALPITSLTAAIFGIMLVFLGLYAGLGRVKTNISLGTEGSDMLLKRVRAHGNFTEYAPIGLIVLALCEYGGKNANMLWAIAGALIIGRIFHAIGLYTEILIFRSSGMLMTLASILASSALLLWP